MKKSRSKAPFSCGRWGGLGWSQEVLVGGRRLVRTGFPSLSPGEGQKSLMMGWQVAGNSLEKERPVSLVASNYRCFPWTSILAC